MLRRILIFLLIAVMQTSALSAGQKTARPVVSILGDSYSTYQGYIPDGNEVWYFNPCDTTRTDVDNVNQTWWRQLIDKGNYRLGKNESYSGATISYRGYRGADYRDRSFITRLPKVGNPDILLIFGCTNDSWAGVPAGEYDFGRTAPDSLLYTFRPAMRRLADDAVIMYPEAEIYFVINSELRPEIVESVKEICNHYNISYIQLENIDKKRGHPTRKGMTAIADQILRHLEQHSRYSGTARRVEAGERKNYKTRPQNPER